MKLWVAITDFEWYSYLASRPDLDEVNFWQPRGGRRPVALEEGDAFLFKLRSERGNWIVGGGTFMRFDRASPALAWKAFGEANGAPSRDAMVARISRIRGGEPVDIDTDVIGINVLATPYFLPEQGWIHQPSDWPKQAQTGFTYDAETGTGKALLDAMGQAAIASHLGIAEAQPAYGKPILIRPRLGQGGFRLAVTEAYGRRCAITGERTLPVLEAAHIKPFNLVGRHELENGLLLRSDLHTLFDRGYVTVLPDYRVRVSGKIREEWANGRDYYALDGRLLTLPHAPNAPPSRDYLEWHSDAVFKG